MTTRVYRFDDVGAPTMGSAVGEVIKVLDAVLVNGYGGKPGAGWTKEFSGTNLAAYKQGVGGKGHFVRIDNTANISIRPRGFENMTGVSVGTLGFPLDGQASVPSGGPHHCWTNASGSIATLRPWIVVASSNFFYLWNLIDNTVINPNNAQNTTMFFGQFESFKTVDPYSTCLIANNSPVASGTPFSVLSATGVKPCSAIARSITEFEGASQIGLVGDAMLSYSMGLTNIGPNFPDPITGGIVLSRPYITEILGSRPIIRGRLPKLWLPIHDSFQFPDAGVVFNGTGDLAGKKFISLTTYMVNGNCGRYCLEFDE